MAYTATNIDLVALIARHAHIQLSHEANHHRYGAEYWGTCPFCGVGKGRDRFHAWMGGERDHYWCRICGATGSPPWFLVEYAGYSFSEACLELGIDQLATQHPESPLQGVSDEPSEKWQTMAWAFVEKAERCLWTTRVGRQALEYLFARGLREETIRRARLGYCPAHADGSWYSKPFDVWGIDPATIANEQKRERGVLVIPPGIVLPWMDGRKLWKLAIKRPGQPHEKDYGQVLGSGEGLYNIDALTMDAPAMLVESELCALSVQQEAGDLLACVATGGVTRSRRTRWYADLAGASVVLQSFDADSAGDSNASHWEEMITAGRGRCVRWRPLSDASGHFKDPNDMLRDAEEFRAFSGYDLRGWVEEGLAITQPLARIPEAPTPESAQEVSACEDDMLYTYASTVSHIVDIFGGPDRVTITRHEPGLTLKEYVRRQPRTYKPRTLPALPRKRCPHAPMCKGYPLAHGWCAEHALSQELLEVGASLGYPGVRLGVRKINEGREITAGIQNWEAYAEIAPARWLEEDLHTIALRYDL